MLPYVFIYVAIARAVSATGELCFLKPLLQMKKNQFWSVLIVFLSAASAALAQRTNADKPFDFAQYLQERKYLVSLDPKNQAPFKTGEIVVSFLAGTKRELIDKIRETVKLQLVKRKNCGCDDGTLPIIEIWAGDGDAGTLQGDITKINATSTSLGAGLLGASFNYYNVGFVDGIAASRGDYTNNFDKIPYNTKQSIKIAILDGGIDLTHEQLQPYIWNDKQEQLNANTDGNKNCFNDDEFGYNFVEDNSDVLDKFGHGTHVAGIVTAKAAKLPLKMLIVKVADNQGIILDSDLACGIKYAIDSKVQVMNLSLGRYGTSNPVIKTLVDIAEKRCITMVCAAGNFNTDNGAKPFYPATYRNKNIIEVAALNEKLVPKWANSNIDSANPQLVWALGEHVKSTFPVNSLLVLSGTSMAAPAVTGDIVRILYNNTAIACNTIRKYLPTGKVGLSQSGGTKTGNGGKKSTTLK
jgi:subtilisin family serine protease